MADSSDSPPRTFDRVTSWARDGDGWTAETPADWMQGRATFGGLVTAAALRAMRTLVEPERTPRSITTSFLGPVTAAPSRLTARILRAGRAVAFAEAEVTQGEALCARFQGVFGAPRPSVAVDVPAPVALPSREDAFPFGYLPGITPQFIQHLDIRWAQGAVPFTGTAGGRTIGAWLRFREPASPGPERVVGLLDVMPSPVIQQLPGPAPASTVSWTAHFVAPDAGAPGDWNYFAYESVAAGDGYCIATGRLYDEAGRLVGWQEQLQAIFG